jgi:uncharacterized membrane protein
MKRALLAGGLALGLLVSPATAQAPSLETRLAELEERVAELEAEDTRDPCVTGAIALSKLPSGKLVLTWHRNQRKVYVAMIDRTCLRGVKDSYRWPGYRRP